MNNSRINYLLLVLASFYCFAASAQLEGETDKPDHSIYRFDISANGLVPIVVGNPAFLKTFSGVYTISGSTNVHVFNDFFIGLSGGYNMFNIPTGKAVSPVIAHQSYNISTLLQSYSLGLNMGYDYFFAPKSFLAFSLAVGDNISDFTDVQMITPVSLNPNFNTTYMKLGANLNFIIDDNFGLGFVVSYTYLNHDFDPTDIAMNQYKGYSPGDSNGAMSFVEIGLNAYIGIVKKKK